VPLYHCFGMVLGNLVYLTHGATMVYPAESFNAQAVLESIEEERCTALHGVPTMFIALLESKHMIIRGGENIFPIEIEQFLFRHPKIRDVQVIGLPDGKYGEEVCACVVLQPGEQASADEIRDFCRGEIAHFKVPRYVRLLDSFPMTVTGKVQKFMLRQMMAAA
jgi:acyl-CoA synthetase (AMP-forming)/AMP-acid ligase II